MNFTFNVLIAMMKCPKMVDVDNLALRHGIQFELPPRNENLRPFNMSASWFLHVRFRVISKRFADFTSPDSLK